MTEELAQQSAPEPGAPRRKWGWSKTLLIILGALLGVSCLTCLVGSYVLFQPGKPVPPTAFIDEATSGIAVLKADSNDAGYRKMLAYAAGAALKGEAPKNEGFRRFLEFVGTNQKDPIPSLTVIASYKGTQPGNLRPFAVVVLSELPRIYRMVVQHFFNGVAAQCSAPKVEGAAIVPGAKLVEALRARFGQGSVPSQIATMLEGCLVSVDSSCIFVGKTAEDVQAGLKAFRAPRPAEGAAWPFLKLYGRADSTAPVFGALSNDNDLLLAALTPPDQVPELRDKVAGAFFLDPHQVKEAAFSVAIVSEDEATAKLSIEGANPDAAGQIAAAVDAFIKSNVESTQKIPLTFAVESKELKDSRYTATIKVTGFRALIDGCFAVPEAKEKATAP